MVGLNYDGSPQKYTCGAKLTGCTSSIAPEEEIKEMSKRRQTLMLKLLATSWCQIIKRNNYINEINCCEKTIKKLKKEMMEIAQG